MNEAQDNSNVQALAPMTTVKTTEVVQQVTQEDLTRCVMYFTEGGAGQWIGGGLTIAMFLLLAFTKQNIPSIVQKIRDSFIKPKA